MIVITGASDGLGAAIVDEALHQEEETLNISRRINTEATRNIIADLSSVDEIRKAAAEISKLESAKAIILNAGVLSLQPFKECGSEEYDRVMNVNLKAPTLIVSLLFDWIREHEVDIVIINSVAGLRGFKGQAIYNISKWGLRGLAESLREELAGTKCRVIGVYPGMLDTNMAMKLPAGPMPKSKHAAIPIEDIARMIVQVINQPKSMEVTDIVIERRR